MLEELYIAPDGKDNDIQKGTKEEPLATVSAALQRISLLKKTGNLKNPFTVWIRGGKYQLQETIVIKPEHSFPVTFKAYPGEQPVFNGGVQISSWENSSINGKTAWVADIPEEAYIFGSIRHFFVNGKRKTRAAFPKNDFLRIAENDLNTLTPGSDRFEVAPNSFDLSWSKPEDIEALVIHKWIDELMPLEKFIPEKNMFISTHKSRFTLCSKDTEYRFENVKEALIESGEYYICKQENRIYYIPEKDEDIDSVEAYIPAIGCFIRYEGKPESGAYVEGINFEGLKFVYGGAGDPEYSSNYDFKDNNAPLYKNYSHKKGWAISTKPSAGSPQGAIHLPGTIFMHGSRLCSISRCKVAHSGWYALEVGSGCTTVSVERNEFCDMGGGGVKIGGVGAEVVEENPSYNSLKTSHIRVTDNHIHDCGLTNFSSIGVLITNAFGNLIEHNHIHDLYYSAISCGWSWGYGESFGRENRIGGNLIHDLGKGILSDMGGVYLLGIQPGTRVYNNHISKIKSRYYGGWGLYTDEGSSHVVIEGNICHDCSSNGFNQHYGRENIIRYNILAFNGKNDTPTGGSAGFCIGGGMRNSRYGFPGDNYTKNLTFINNIIVQDGKPFMQDGYMPSLYDVNQFYINNNIYWDINGNDKLFAESLNPDIEKPKKIDCNWKEWQEHGYDSSSKFIDPGFVDMLSRNFNFLDDSPCHEIMKGYKFVHDKAGIRKEK